MATVDIANPWRAVKPQNCISGALLIVTALHVLIVSCTGPVNPFDTPHNLSYRDNPAIYRVGEEIPANMLSCAGKEPFEFAIDPQLPPDLTFDTATGTVSGIPADVLPQTGFTVTAANAEGTATVELVMTILPPPPESLTYAVNPVAYRVHMPVSTNAPSWQGGDPTSFAVDPALPSGLWLNVVTGEIAGTPLDVSTETAYVVTAANSAGSTQVVLLISVADSSVDSDVTPPALDYHDPPVDSIVISSDSRTIKVGAADPSGVTRVALSLRSDTVDAAVSSDTIWSATVSGLEADTYNEIIITAWDGATPANRSTLLLYIKYDPTIGDNTGPTITPVAGPASGDRVTDSVVTLVFDVGDDTGLDSIFWSLNGEFGGTLEALGGGPYRIADTLTKYHSNTFVVTAIDASSNRNRTTRRVDLDYNTMPQGVSSTSPANGATGIESSGLTLMWTGGDDPDGDSVAYVVRYGTDAAVLAMGGVTSDKQYSPSPALCGNTTYYWIIFVTTETDTVRCPSAGVYSFATADHPATVTGLIDRSITINDSLWFEVDASDPDGVSLYRWDFDGDGTYETSGTSPSAGYRFGTEPSYTVRLTVVDNSDSTTTVAATVTVTNESPQVSAGADTSVGLGDMINLHGAASDDGSIVTYEWSMERWGSPVSFIRTSGTDTSFKGPAENLPDSLMCVLRTTDEDGNAGLDTVKVSANMIWRVATPNAPFEPRAGHTLTYYNGSLWLVGGIISSTRLGDVWQSEDGVSWNATGTIPAMAYHAADVFAERLWVVGNPAGRGTMLFFTLNGTALVTAVEDPPMHGLLDHTLTTFGQLWIVGGQENRDTVWRSADGFAWENVGAVPYFAPRRYYHTTTVFRDSLWVIGGRSAAWDLRDDIVCSADGVSWSLKTADAPFPARCLHKAAVFKGRLWVVGGETQDGAVNDVWYTENCIEWKKATEHAAFAARTFYALAVSPDRSTMWVAGGYVDGEEQNDVWYTTDGP